jgi:hypothetical protein
MQVTVYMAAVLPGNTISTSVNSSVTIAETIIVGSVPDGYTHVNGDDASTIGKINDYQANTP